MMISRSLSRSPRVVLQKQISYLKKGVIDPSLHYHSKKQSEAWERVFEAHCPVLKEDSFRQIYQRLFSRFTVSTSQKIHLIGLGCGTGVKERWLAKSMKRGGVKLDDFTAVDVSESLCRQSMKQFIPYCTHAPRAWVMDLDAAKELRHDLDQKNRSECRIFTFFGLVPNLEPDKVVRILKILLRPQDQLLISANLVPAKNELEKEVLRGMRVILPQYRNQETKEWLSLLFQEQGISSQCLSGLKFEIERKKEISSVLVRTEIKKDFEWEMGSTRLGMKKGRSLTVFQSRRWTSIGFEKWLAKGRFKVKGVEMTSNFEEGVWWVER